MSTHVPDRAAALVAHGRVHGLTIGTAESLTGGLLCARLIDVPGASAVVVGGIVAYQTQTKASVLGVPDEVLTRHGAVSEQTARAMAAAACRLLGSSWSLATTGVAGPDPSEGQAPGTVHLAVHGIPGEGEEVSVHQALTLHGTRVEVRQLAVEHMLELVSDTWDIG